MDASTSARPLVLHIIDELPPDGAERLLVDLLQHRSDQFDYHVLCIIQGGLLQAEIEALGVPVTILSRKSKFDVGYLFKLAKFIRSLRPIAVHTHLFTADAWGRLAAYLAGVRKIFSTVHSTNDWMSRTHIQVDTLLAKISTHVIACSDKVADQLIHDRKLGDKRVKLIPNGVAIDRFAQNEPLNLPNTFGTPEKTTVFALVGRLHEAKGHLYILPILQQLKAKGLNFHCLLVGEGELEREIKKAVSTLQLDQHVTLTGFRKDIPSLLKSVDFLIMPSRWEGLPITLLEAMAAHTPVIASTVGGIPTVLDNGKAGVLVNPNNDQEWLTQIERLITDADYRTELANTADHRVLEHYSAAAVQQQYERLYIG